MKLILFDCDGTIADSQHAIVAAMTEVFRLHGLPPPSRPRVLEVIGLSLVEAMRRLVPDAEVGLVRKLAQRYGPVAAEMREQPEHREPLFPGARECITRLGNRTDFVLGIATGKSLRGLRLLLAREGLTPVFQTLQTADTHPSKPNPSMIEAALAETGVAARDTVMIGDTTFDVEMAHRANVGSIGVTWGYHARSALQAAGALSLVDDFGGLEEAIEHHFAASEAAA